MTADASTKRQILTRKVERIATLCHPRTRKEKGRWWTAALLLITCLVVGVVLGIYWSRAPCPFDVRAQAEPLADHDSSRVVTGIVTTATAIHIGETLPDKPGGDLSNHVSPPGVFLDNTRNWELGALTAWRDLRTTLRNDFSRAQTQSVEDKDLAIAQPQSNYQSDSWMRPSTESEYRTGIDALDRYSEDLADNRATHAQFFARADNLAFYLEVVQKRLGILAQRLSYAVGQVRLDTALACDPSARQSTPVSAQTQTKTPWMKIDDIFFDARGYTWALLETLHGMEIDFAPVLKDKNAVVSLERITRELKNTQNIIWSPLILNGTGFGPMANHSLMKASCISLVNAAITDLRNVLKNGGPGASEGQVAWESSHQFNDIIMTTIPCPSLMAMELIPGAGVIAPVGAQMQVAETSGEWAVRPAAEANPLMQSTDATASPSVPPSDARSLEIKTDGGIRYIAGGIGERGRSGLNAISQDSTCT